MTHYGKRGDKRCEKNDWSLYQKAEPGERCIYEKCPNRRKQAQLILMGMPFHVECFRAAGDPGITYKHSYAGGHPARQDDE